MARRNLLRSLLAASVMVVSSTTGLVVAAPPPAGAADVNLYQVRLSEERGFNPGAVKVRVGDYIAFILEKEASSNVHSVTFDDHSLCPTADGDLPCWPELRFNDENQKCMLRNYVLPNTRCIEVRVRPESGLAPYHDRLAQEAGGRDSQGLVEVVAPSTAPPPPTTSTTVPPTTSTTAAPTTTTATVGPTTTTTIPPTTATTAPTTIRPFLIGSPASSTTTALPPAGTDAAGSGKSSGGGTGTSGSKGKGKAGSGSSSTTAPAAPEAPPAEMTFDTALLALGPVTLPESVHAAETADGADLDAAAVMDLLDSEEEAAGDRGGFLLLAAGLGLFLLGGGFVAWYRRSSRYLPA